LGTPPTVLPGVTSPSDRIKSLKELAQKAPTTTDQGIREMVCADLARQIYKEPDSIIRSEILRTLAAYGGVTASKVLHVAAKDPDADVRVIVCELWGRRTDAEAAQVLGTMLTSDADKDVRLAAARALGHSHDPSAVQALGTALNDTDPAMQNRAMVALHETTGKEFGLDVDRWQQFVKTGQAREDTAMQRIFGWYH